MAITPIFKNIPKDVVEWARFFSAVRRGDGDIEDVELRDSAANSVIGRAEGSPGTPGDIAASADDQFMRTRGGTLGFGAILDSDIPATIARDAEVTAAIAAHEALPDPHPVYTTAAELTAAITAHEALADPHPVYTTAAELSTAITAAVSALNLASGTYTPTLTNVTNVDASTAYACQYLRVGSTVHVSGRIDVDATAAASTDVGISLPIASNLGAVENLGGTAFCNAIQQGAAIFGDAANDRANLQFLANSTANNSFLFSFTYKVI